MDGALRIAAALLATVATLGFWFLIVILIPGIVAVYVASLFPATGQWRKRWAERRAKPKH